jgi:alkyl hydroperoxide reductase subunit F
VSETLRKLKAAQYTAATPARCARPSGRAGIPMGHEFTSLVLALLQTGGHPPKVDAAVIEQIKGLLKADLPLRDLYLAVLPQLPGRGAGAQPDGRAQPRRRERDDRRRLFQDEVGARQIMAVPTVC